MREILLPWTGSISCGNCKNTGWKKFYLIFGMCDESFTVNCTVDPPEGTAGCDHLSGKSAALCSDRIAGGILPEGCAGKYSLRTAGADRNTVYCGIT